MKPMLPKRTRRLRARAATINTQDSEFEDYGPEPNMKLSHAFLVVLLLHLIAVGGIYAFNSYKAEKAPKLTASNAAASSEQSPDSQNQPAPAGPSGPEDPANPPPSEEKPPVVAKTSDAPDTKAGESKGVLARVKAALFRMMGNAAGAGAATATVVTASAQESTNSEASAQPAAAAPATPPPTMPTNYVVKAGDTITKISASLGVTILDLEKANGLTGSSVLQVGENLKVPEKGIAQQTPGTPSMTEAATAGVQPVAAGAPSGAAEMSAAASVQGGVGAATGEMIDYTVVKGDNPYKIAKKFKISTVVLMKINNITDPKKIQIGQKLKIPAAQKTGK